MTDAERVRWQRPGRRLFRRALQLGALGVVALGLVCARVVIAGEHEIAASTEALRQGDPVQATVRARRAAGWYAPGAPHVRVAYERLRALAQAAEQHRRFDLALLAWRAVRSSSTETRWLVTPHAADLEQADREIARLLSMPVGERGTVGEPDPALAAAELETLGREPGPRVPWMVALVAAFALGAAGLALAARQMGEGAATAAAGGWWRAAWTRARSGLLLTALGLGLWLLALWRA